MAISEMKGQGWRDIPTQYSKASDILTSTLATFLFSSHPKRERDPEAHLNYYATFSRLLRHPAWKQSGAILKEKIQEKLIRKENISKKKKGSKSQEAKGSK